MQDDIDNLVRDLAALHGRPDVTEQEIDVIKQAVSTEIIDNMLDDVTAEE